MPMKLRRFEPINADAAPRFRSLPGEGKAKVWYTGFALSDLAVSGGLAFQAKFAWHTDFPKPLQRIHLSLLPGDSALDRTIVPALNLAPSKFGARRPGKCGSGGAGRQ